MQQIFSVSKINQYIQEKMDTDPFLSNVAVCGEISNYKLYPSGHHYFSLKDENGTLRCVMFKGNAFRLRFRPENGMKIIAVGKITVFPRDGAYQLYCTNMTVDGVGDLHVAFEQLKRKLSAQGLFDSQHKQSLPQYPQTIGIVTSAAGAALHDMLRILNKRYPLVKVLLFSARVQGAEAPEEIASAIRYANAHNLVDLLIVGRGGGSMEDLWAFNDEIVAHAIYDSKIPVISAVGHEPDVTISDYVADLRAATPSNAAELAVPDQDSLRQSLDSFYSCMAISLQRHLKTAQQNLSLLSKSTALQSPINYFEQKSMVVDHLKQRLCASQINNFEHKIRKFVGLSAKLDAMSPLKVMTRGYAILENHNAEVIRSVKQLSSGDQLHVRLADGRITATVHDIKEES